MSELPDTGKVVIAHPSRVAEADQVAAKEGIERVALRTNVSPRYAYIVDLDELRKLPDPPRFLPWASGGSE